MASENTKKVRQIRGLQIKLMQESNPLNRRTLEQQIRSMPAELIRMANDDLVQTQQETENPQDNTFLQDMGLGG
jgi:hypothetical protein